MPGGSGVVFATLSDETGICNIVVWPRLVEVFRREIMGARLMLVEGVVQRSEEGVVHLVARRIYDRSTELARLTEDEVDAPSLRSQAARSPTAKHPRDVRTVPKSRDFH
jgi:error-prone DNA polymerase